MVFSKKPLALLVVDVCEDWEEAIKHLERGYEILFEQLRHGRFIRSGLNPERNVICYPHGSARAGLDAIIDTARLAHLLDIPAYAASLYDGWSDGEEQPCDSLKPYIPEGNRYDKGQYSAFKSRLAERLASDHVEHLMIIGYDRDCCVLETAKDAVERGIQVVTSEHCMLTVDKDSRRDASMAFYRERTAHLESLVDVWNYLRESKLGT